MSKYVRNHNNNWIAYSFPFMHHYEIDVYNLSANNALLRIQLITNTPISVSNAQTKMAIMLSIKSIRHA